MATDILTDREDDETWEAQFEATTADQWNHLVETARQEIAAGDTIPLEDAFSVERGTFLTAEDLPQALKRLGASSSRPGSGQA